MTVAEAIGGYTRGPALASGRYDQIGSLTPGKRADFVVLSADPTAVLPEELEAHSTVQATYVGGRRVDPGGV
jgi:predicted amidohydrolase YtcJ